MRLRLLAAQEGIGSNEPNTGNETPGSDLAYTVKAMKNPFSRRAKLADGDIAVMKRQAEALKNIEEPEDAVATGDSWSAILGIVNPRRLNNGLASLDHDEPVVRF